MRMLESWHLWKQLFKVAREGERSTDINSLFFKNEVGFSFGQLGFWTSIHHKSMFQWLSWEPLKLEWIHTSFIIALFSGGEVQINTRQVKSSRGCVNSLWDLLRTNEANEAHFTFSIVSTLSRHLPFHIDGSPGYTG